jgi:hypothetical protein
VIGVAAQRGRTPGSWADRVTAACLAVVIVVGSGLVWIGVPVAGFWAAGRVTTDAVTAVLFALLAIPTTMVAVGWSLYRVSERYEALRGGEPRRASPPAWRTSLSEERASVRRGRGERRLIEVSMTISCCAALLVLTIWFFFFAELRLSPLP